MRLLLKGFEDERGLFLEFFFVKLISFIYACTSTWKHPAVPSGTHELWNERSFISLSLSLTPSLFLQFYSLCHFSSHMTEKVTGRVYSQWGCVLSDVMNRFVSYRFLWSIDGVFTELQRTVMRLLVTQLAPKPAHELCKTLRLARHIKNKRNALLSTWLAVSERAR